MFFFQHFWGLNPLAPFPWISVLTSARRLRTFNRVVCVVSYSPTCNMLGLVLNQLSLAVHPGANAASILDMVDDTCENAPP